MCQAFSVEGLWGIQRYLAPTQGAGGPSVRSSIVKPWGVGVATEDFAEGHRGTEANPAGGGAPRTAAWWQD